MARQARGPWALGRVPARRRRRESRRAGRRPAGRLRCGHAPPWLSTRPRLRFDVKRSNRSARVDTVTRSQIAHARRCQSPSRTRTGKGGDRDRGRERQRDREKRRVLKRETRSASRTQDMISTRRPPCRAHPCMTHPPGDAHLGRTSSPPALQPDTPPRPINGPINRPRRGRSANPRAPRQGLTCWGVRGGLGGAGVSGRGLEIRRRHRLVDERRRLGQDAEVAGRSTEHPGAAKNEVGRERN